MAEVADRLLLRKQILEACFELHETPITFAGGQPANNKLDAERLEHNRELRRQVVPAMGILALEYDPEFIIGVPNGATWLGDAIAAEINCYPAHLKRLADGSMDYESQQVDWEMVVSPLTRGVLVKDVFNRFTNTRRALAVPELAPRIAGIIAVWDRGVDHPDRQPPSQPHQALISEHIPEVLPLEHGLLELRTQ